MKKWMTMGVLIFLSFMAPAFAAENPVAKGVQGSLDTFTEGCQQELTTFCKDVTPGDGRILACLYAFQDKLTSRCEHALYDSVGQLKKTLTDLTYAVNECQDDLQNICADVEPGQGRVLDCLENNADVVSGPCKTALKDVGYIK